MAQLTNNEYVPAFYHNDKLETLFDGENAFQEVVISNIADLFPFLKTDIAYSYRGQANKDWPLKTTIERFFEGRDVRIAKKHIEEKIINKYKTESSVFSQILKYDPLSQKYLDLLADIQHFGGPTRLLDFTNSINVALFFATFNNTKNDSAVYCIRDLMINSETFDIRDILQNVMMAPGVEETLPSPKDKKKLLSFHDSERKNERLKNQKGYFLYADIETSFEEALSYSLGGIPFQFIKQLNPDLEEIILRSSVIKLVIPKEISKDIQIYLKKSGITASILFPDYQGCIMSLYETDTERF